MLFKNNKHAMLANATFKIKGSIETDEKRKGFNCNTNQQASYSV